ncbi:hypothetical protein BGX21_004891 [Mortierella sp. AD011]|nr:hypothetical protein BGX21_004891 [Mortierella sp. AD011]
MATIRRSRVFPNSSLMDSQTLGVESVAITDFSQTEDVFASLPTVQSQSKLLTKYEFDQQYGNGSQAVSRKNAKIEIGIPVSTKTYGNSKGRLC